MSRPRSAPTILAFGKLGACVTLPSIDPDSCLHLKILRRHSIGNKERRAEQSSCLCRHTRTTINYVWNILVSRLAALFGVPTASFNAAGNATERQHLAAGQSVAWGGVCKWGRHIWTSASALYSVNDGLPPWCKARVICPSQGCARPGIHP